MVPPPSPNHSPPPKVQRLNPGKLTLSEEEHAEQDQEILALCQIGQMPAKLDLQDASWLLATIVDASDGLLDGKYVSRRQAVKLIQTEYYPMGELQDAWSKKSFADIRCLRVLQNKSLPSQEVTSEQGMWILNKAVQKTAITSAWSMNYEGNHHRILYNSINHMIRSKPYSNSVAIVQSSGTGKSRMVHEQASLVFTIPFNLRDREDDSDLSFPPPDALVRSYLVNHTPVDNVTHAQLHYYTFLKDFTMERLVLNVYAYGSMARQGI